MYHCNFVYFSDMILIIIIVIILYLTYLLWVFKYKHWDKRGVISEPGKFPFGSNYKMTVMSEYDGYIQNQVIYRFEIFIYKIHIIKCHNRNSIISLKGKNKVIHMK